MKYIFPEYSKMILQFSFVFYGMIFFLEKQIGGNFLTFISTKFYNN
jgi:hypothetical protein